MPLLGTRGAASAKAFGLTAGAKPPFMTLATDFVGGMVFGTASNALQRVVLINGVTGTNYSSWEGSSLGTSAAEQRVFGGFDKGFGKNYSSQQVGLVTRTSGSQISGAGNFFATANFVAYAVLSPLLVIAFYSGSFWYSTNGGATWSSTQYLSTALGVPTVNAVVGAVTYNGVLYICAHCNSSSPYDLKWYKTSNLTSYTNIPSTNNTTENIFNWNSFYNYTDGIYYVYNINSGYAFEFRVYNETSIDTGTIINKNAVERVVYVKSTATENYWGTYGNDIKKSSNLTTWTTVRSQADLSRIYPASGGLFVSTKNTNNFNGYYYNISANTMTNRISYYSPGGWSPLSYIYPVTTGDNYWQGA